MSRLEGKRAVVLGCGGQGNIGQAIARRFQQDGAKVVVASRNETSLRDFSAELGIDYCLCDITEKASCEALGDFVVDRLGGIDIAVQSAGWGLLKPFLENDEDTLEKMARLQFIGPMYFFQSMIPRLSDRSAILTISSVTASIAINDHAAYQGTKAGIDHVVKVLAAEFGPRGIRINSIAPALTDTPMTIGMDEWKERARIRTPLRRIGTPEDVAAAASWLSSDECFMSGEILQVNGGYSLTGSVVEPR